MGLDFDGMLADLEAAPDGSVVLLHGCAHNPTGVDPTQEQWVKIVDLLQKKKHLVGGWAGSSASRRRAPLLFSACAVPMPGMWPAIDSSSLCVT